MIELPDTKTAITEEIEMHRYFSPIKFRYGSNFDIQEQRTALIKQVFSDLIVTSFRKRGNYCQTQKKRQDRKEGRIRSAREGCTKALMIWLAKNN
jgi:hypothetical protein